MIIIFIRNRLRGLRAAAARAQRIFVTEIRERV